MTKKFSWGALGPCREHLFLSPAGGFHRQSHTISSERPFALDHQSPQLSGVKPRMDAGGQRAESYYLALHLLSLFLEGSWRWCLILSDSGKSSAGLPSLVRRLCLLQCLPCILCERFHCLQVKAIVSSRPSHSASCLSAGLSYNSILGRFMVFSTDTEVSRKMLSVNDPGSLLMAVHPSARNILGDDIMLQRHSQLC